MTIRSPSFRLFVVDDTGRHEVSAGRAADLAR